MQTDPWQAPGSSKPAGSRDSLLRGARTSIRLALGLSPGLAVTALALGGARIPFAFVPAVTAAILGAAMAVAPGQVEPLEVLRGRRSLQALLDGLEPPEHALWALAGVVALASAAGLFVYSS